MGEWQLPPADAEQGALSVVTYSGTVLTLKMDSGKVVTFDLKSDTFSS